MSRRHQSILNVLSPSFSNVYSFEFDGVDENFSSSLTVPNSDKTLSYWVNANGTYTNNPTQGYGPAAIMASNGSTTQNAIGLMYYKGNELYPSMQGWNPERTLYQTWTARDLNFEGAGWHHILWTYDSSTEYAQCFVDGSGPQTFTQFIGSGTTTNIWSENAIYNGGFSIGSQRSGVNFAGYFEGLVDEVAVFNSVLSQTDINTIYGTGTPSSLAALNPVAWYRMGEEATFSNPGGTGTWTLTDQGSGSNNATSANMEEADRKENIPT